MSSFAPLQRLVIAIAVLASFVTFLDGTVVNVALPAISEELGGGITTQQWVVDAYLITLSALILLAGSLSDAYGRVLVMRIGLIAFGIASVAVAAAIDPLMLIVARGAQGAAGALLVPSSLALITATMRGDLQARAIGVWTAFTTAAQLVGPLLGGLFVDFLSWRFVFLINVLPIGVTLLLLARLHLPEHPRSVRVDWWSGALCALGLGAIVFSLIEQPNLGWASPAIWIPAVVGAALFAVFLWRQGRSATPLMPLWLFRVRDFGWGNLATLFVYAALSLNGFVVGVYLQQGAGLSATAAGLASLPMTILMILLSSRAGGWAGRWGPRIFMTVGPLIMAVGALMLLTVNTAFDYWAQVLPAMIVMGLGLSLTVAPLTAAILGAIDENHSGIASAVNNAVSRVAGLLVVAMLSTIVGGSLDLDGFHNAAWVTAALLVLGGVVSWIGIRRNPSEAAAPPVDAPAQPTPQPR
ncbi:MULTISPECIES: MFS transporter [unclassified Microbacterium]|uniref:MFS transporter n=1 Tax=unclassified Microbacterium TaxID=2609290 RepID=UPI002468DD91|nr:MULTISPECIES: MFS transporter [unclassified Microbacterium]MDH5134006.1 MFS transporter [Microbacterium sp. RD10]MDH5136902.1 MFS transporter [Microbacterium sp. RD11]MDH5144133.1 MFS transporter [Microbacterium sp. RD12]MDH5153290.1 MFS transporter [Microbacterium sp. RD06]MDH5166091.1 MFS transporter [Microbacterium sp. RD02]